MTMISLLFIFLVFLAILIWIIWYTLTNGPIKYFFYEWDGNETTKGCLHDYTHWDEKCPDDLKTEGLIKIWENLGYKEVYTSIDFSLWVSESGHARFKQFHTYGR